MSASVRAYTSKDLVNWEGPTTIFQVPKDLWGEANILNVWAPEMHFYKGKYYLFLTFNTDSKLTEQWREWQPRVKRGSQVLVSDSPLGPFKPYANHSTPPVDMMTLDGTLWVEDGVPYMVFAHEWVQITDGTIEYVKLKDDLSETAGDPKRLFAVATLRARENRRNGAAGSRTGRICIDQRAASSLWSGLVLAIPATRWELQFLPRASSRATFTTPFP